MNEIPSSGPEREAYIISVMQGVKREGDEVVNLQAVPRGDANWMRATAPRWDWLEFDYRLYEPEVVHYANGYENRICQFRETISECKRVSSNATHYVKRTTGGGRTIPEYESIPLERGE